MAIHGRVPESFRRWLLWLPLAFPALLSAQQADAPRVRCRLVQHFACGPNGCNTVAADSSPVELVLPALSWLRETVARGPTNVTIQRCVAGRCTEQSAQVDATPHMLALVSAPAAYLLKIYDGPSTPLLTSGTVVEVETVVLGTHTRYGQCGGG
ncbi:MAG: hypothetical protein U0132_16960 [Gemmatimonadaceae bacterium]